MLAQMPAVRPGPGRGSRPCSWFWLRWGTGRGQQGERAAVAFARLSCPPFLPRVLFLCSVTFLVGSDITGPRFWSFPCWSVAGPSVPAGCPLASLSGSEETGASAFVGGGLQAPGCQPMTQPFPLWAHVGSLPSSVVPGRGRTPGVSRGDGRAG